MIVFEICGLSYWSLWIFALFPVLDKAKRVKDI